MPDEGLTLKRVQAAASRLDGVAHRTPVLSSSVLDQQCGGEVLLKAEPFQRSGSFKFRGAYNRLSLLDPPARAAGVVAFSSGNHPDRESREEVAAEIAADRGLTLIRPFDDYDVMAGQGTAGLELTEQVPGLELVLVPVGGGGLAAGVSTAVKGALAGAAVIGVEPDSASDTSQSMQAGRRVAIPEPDTIADGLRARQPGELTFAVNARLLDEVVTVSEAAIVEAMRFCFSRLKVVVEPSGAVALAALLSGVITPAGRTAVVLSGGNVAPADFAALAGS